MKQILNLFSEIIKLVSIYADSNDSDEEKERILTSKQAYEWFLSELENEKSTRVQTTKSRMQSGKIYVFKYNPLYRDKLSYYDVHPIILALGNITENGKKKTLGVNISWYPPSARKYIIEKIRDILKNSYQNSIKKFPFQANNQSPIYMDLFQLKILLDSIGFSFAIRQYIEERIISPKVCVCYEDWNKAIMLDQPRIFPELYANDSYYSIKNIYLDFIQYIDRTKNKKIDVNDLRKKIPKFENS